MKILDELCSEECIQKLQITRTTSLEKIMRISELQGNEVFEIKIERFDRKKIDVVVKINDTVEDVWKSLKFSNAFSRKAINLKTTRNRYNLSYNSQVLQKNKPISAYGIIEGSVLKFQRKIR